MIEAPRWPRDDVVKAWLAQRPDVAEELPRQIVFILERYAAGELIPLAVAVNPTYENSVAQGWHQPDED